MTDTLKEILRIYKEYTCHDTYCYNLLRDCSNKTDKSKRWLVILTKLPETNTQEYHQCMEYSLLAADILRVIKIIDIQNPLNCIKQIITKNGTKYEINEIIEKKRNLIASFTTIQMAYCNRKRPRDFTGTWINDEKGRSGAITKTMYMNGKKEGLEIKRMKTNNKKVSEINYKNGKIHGTMKCWWTNGTIEEMMYNEGKPEGLKIVWDKNGNKIKETNYEKGKPNGLSTTWYKNGNVESQLYYNKKGKTDGIGIEFYKNGIKKEERQYTNGFALGLCIGFYSSGKINYIEEQNIDRRIRIEFYENGMKKIIINDLKTSPMVFN